ncbi:MAG: hypothetical protein AB7P99_19975 [Vicinamibacterales bacterium]
METDHLKVALTGAWILGIAGVGYIRGATSFAAWVVLVVLSLAPPMVMARLWNTPAQSLSESIRAALR